MPKPLCFIVMPYGRKPTLAEAGHGPAEIDFDALWQHAYFPVIEALGYEPVRADQDNGALIINQMLERLYFADLVVADMTIPNGNVYYEVGIRHAAKKQGCVLLAADWSRQLFDVAQMRTVRYALPEGEIVQSTAQSIQDAIREPIRRMALGSSPMHESIRGYPDQVDESAASSMKDQMAKFAAFQASVRAARLAPQAERAARVQELVAAHGVPPLTSPVALTLVRLMLDSAEQPADWESLLDFIGKLPDEIAEQPEVREKRAFALSGLKKEADSIGELEGLVAAAGPTPERLGLIGGRYKRLLRSSTTPAERQKYLAKAIECYERGMDLDLNEYYCSSNLPRLYRQRMRKGDEERAQSVLRIVIAACERAKKRAVTDEWLRPTLLNAAFDVGDPDKAEELAADVLAEGASKWKLDSVLSDLKASLEHVADHENRDRLAAVIVTLESQ
jgi:hypothetical protein